MSLEAGKGTTAPGAQTAEQAARFVRGMFGQGAPPYDLITCAFGFRNFANYRRGIAELLRALKPGGTAAILEFSTPPNPLFRAFYGFYSTRVLPFVGGMISGSKDAYTYLPESVKKFPA